MHPRSTRIVNILPFVIVGSNIFALDVSTIHVLVNDISYFIIREAQFLIQFICLFSYTLVLIASIHQDEDVGAVANHILQNLPVLYLLNVRHNLLIGIVKWFEFFYLSFCHTKINSCFLQIL